MNEDAGWEIEPDALTWAEYESYIGTSLIVAQELFDQGNYTAVVDRLKVLLAEIDQGWRREMPGNAPYLVAQVYYYIGLSLFCQAPTSAPKEFYANIEGLMRTAIEIDRNQSDIWRLLSQTLLQQLGSDGSFLDVEEVLRGVVSCVPSNLINSAWAFHKLALRELALREPKFEPEVSKATSSKEDDRRRFVRSRLKKQGIDLHPDELDRPVLERQARLAARIEYDQRIGQLNWDKALLFASAATQLDPNESEYWSTLGDAHPAGSVEQLRAYQMAAAIKSKLVTSFTKGPDSNFSRSEHDRRSRSAKQCERSHLIIFDLDGTLANTADIEQQDRTPATLLAPGVDAEGHSLQAHRWAWSQDVSETPARLIERGHRVVIATNSPLPYASTLTHLLGVEHQGLHTNCGGEKGKANRIKQICSSWGNAGEDVIYVGDREADVRTAAIAGVRYMTVDQLRSGELLDDLGTPSRGNDSTPTLLNGLDIPKYWKEELSSGRVPFSRPGSPAITGERKLFETFAAMCEWAATSSRLENCDFLDVALAMADESDTLAPYYRTILQFALRSHPGLPTRRDIQFLLLLYAAQDERADVIAMEVDSPMKEHFAFRPELLTRREKNEDDDLRHQYLRAFRMLFPELNHDNLSCVVNYWRDGVYGNLLKIVKDYSINPKGPGPDVRLGLLDGIADLCAGMMSLDTEIPIVPVPSSPFNNDKPGQNSTRLARCIADRTARQLRPVLEIEPTASPGQKEFRINPEAINLLPRGSAYDLFDDQITSGLTVRKCQQVMEVAGYRLNRVLSYSAKPSKIAGVSQNSTAGVNEGAHLNRWRQLKIRFEEGF